ncbi:MAG: hypothetical protein ACE144_20840 [Thermodesulfobacteriota bacterium]
MIDMDSQKRVKSLQLYLSPEEAAKFRKELERLLANPETNDHSHIDFGGSSEFSFSILTENKLKNLKGYSKIEQKILSEEE